MIHVQKEGLTIQEAADMTGLTAHTLRYYEKIGLLESIGRLENGHRRYDEADLGWIHFLKLLRGTGMPIQQMQQFMALARQGDDSIADRIDLLEAHRADLFTRISELQDYLDHLDRKIAYYKGVLTGIPAEPCE